MLVSAGGLSLKFVNTLLHPVQSRFQVYQDGIGIIQCALDVLDLL